MGNINRKLAAVILSFCLVASSMVPTAGAAGTSNESDTRSFETLSTKAVSNPSVSDVLSGEVTLIANKTGSFPSASNYEANLSALGLTPGKEYYDDQEGASFEARTYTIDSVIYEIDWSDDDFAISESGAYATESPTNARIDVYVYYTAHGDNEARHEDELFYSTSIKVIPDMSAVTLSRSVVAVANTSDGYYADTGYVQIKINSGVDLSSAEYGYDLSVKTSKSDVKLRTSTLPFSAHEPYISKSTLYVPLKGKGTTTLTITIYGKTFQTKVTLYKASLETSTLIAKGKTKALKVKGVPKSQITWSSTNKKVVSVNKKTGKIKARKLGNAVIYATAYGTKLGTAVSSTTKKKVKAVKRGFKLAKGKYSQARRMSSGYYDCSSLVWRAYRYAKGCTFGDRWYAPTAAGEAKYLASRKKILKKKLMYKNIQKMTFQAGDLFFKTGESNGEYKGIYHVEMFAGYRYIGETTKGKPILTTRWCTRSDGYSGAGIIGRP